MRCLICKRSFTKNLTFSTFLKNKKDLICDSCFKRYPFHITYSVIPLRRELHIYSLFDKRYSIPENAFLIEYSRLFEFVLNKAPSPYILLYNNFYLSEKMIKNIDHLMKLVNQDIYILCNYFN